MASWSGALYLPNGNPRPGAKFDYKLRWFERLIRHAQDLLDADLPVVLAGVWALTSLENRRTEDPNSSTLCRAKARMMCGAPTPQSKYFSRFTN